MPKTKKIETTKFIEPVDLSAIDAKQIGVVVDGKELPFKIGSKIEIENDSPVIRTVVSIKIDVDGRASYCLEWFNGTDFKYDWVSAHELHYMHVNTKRRKVVSLN